MEDIPQIIIELKFAENLRPEIREEYGLPERGLVIKKIKRSSLATFEYVPLKTGFSDYFMDLLSKINMKDFVEKAREKF